MRSPAKPPEGGTTNAERRWATLGKRMTTVPLKTVIRHLRRAAGPRDSEASDGRLLSLFVSRRDEAAFAALVRRHGPMVLGVCRRLLRHRQDAEDAFQAAFLVLVRRAADIRRRE